MKATRSLTTFKIFDEALSDPNESLRLRFRSVHFGELCNDRSLEVFQKIDCNWLSCAKSSKHGTSHLFLLSGSSEI